MSQGRARLVLIVLLALMLAAWGVAAFWLRPASSQSSHIVLDWTYRHPRDFASVLFVTDDNSICFSDEMGNLNLLSPQRRRIFSSQLPEEFDYVLRIESGRDGHLLCHSMGGRVVEVDGQGELVWKFEPRHWEAEEHPPGQNPRPADILSYAGGITYGLSRDGEMLWAQVLPQWQIHSNNRLTDKGVVLVDIYGNVQRVGYDGHVELLVPGGRSSAEAAVTDAYVSIVGDELGNLYVCGFQSISRLGVDGGIEWTYPETEADRMQAHIQGFAAAASSGLICFSEMSMSSMGGGQSLVVLNAAGSEVLRSSQQQIPGTIATVGETLLLFENSESPSHAGMQGPPAPAGGGGGLLSSVSLDREDQAHFRVTAHTREGVQLWQDRIVHGGLWTLSPAVSGDGSMYVVEERTIRRYVLKEGRGT